MVLVLSASQPRFALFICPWLKQQFLSAAMQPSDGSARRPASRSTYSSTVQPAHGSPSLQETMISSLNIESARDPICKQPRPTSLELLEYRCNGSRTNLKEQFYQSLELLDRREAARKHHQQRQTHCQEPHDDGASTQTPELSDKQNKFKEVGDEEEARKLSEGEEISSCESVSTSTRKTPLSSGAEQDQEAQRSEPRQPEYKERDKATSSSLRRARPKFKRGKALNKEKQRQLQQTIQSQIQPTSNQDHVPDPADNSAERPVNIMRFDSSHACRAEQPEYLGRDEAT